jgi:glycosyltransferase involved in cell wall biosynthesis
LTNRTEPTIALVVVTRDAAQTIARCIRSARQLASSILVVDSFSNDDTVEIARREGAVVLQRPFLNYSDQRNWASDQIPRTSDWILHLDADEYLTPPLGVEIASAVEGAGHETVGFLMRRNLFFLRREMRHGGLGTTWHLRLYRNGQGWCEERRYDQHFMASGRTERLHNFFVDDNPATLAHWTDRHNQWSTAEAQEILSPSSSSKRVRPTLFGSPINRKRWLKDRAWHRLPILWRAFAYFGLRYFLCLGFLDGREGLIFHALQGFWFRFLVDSKIFEQKLLHPSQESGLVDSSQTR